MRYSLIALIIVLLLTGCIGPKYYTNKGVSYFEQPVKEVDSFYKVVIPQVGGENNIAMPLTGKPLVLGQKLFFPVETAYAGRNSEPTFTTIYMYDTQNDTVTDSLVLKDENVKQSYRNIVLNSDLYIIGIKDSLCHIYKTDTNLKVIEEYSTGINIFYIAYAAMNNGNIRIVAKQPNKDIVLYDLNTENLQPVRKRLLLKDYYASSLDHNNLWFFAASESEISIAKTDLSVFDPNPEYKTFKLQIPEKAGFRAYSASAAGSVAYFSWSWFKQEGGLASKLVSINFEDGTQTSKDVEGSLTFKVISANDKTYIYRTTMVKKKEAFTVAELMPDLSEVNRKISFFVTEQEHAQNIYQYNENKFFLTGHYLHKTGNKIIQDIPGLKKVKVDEMFPQAFLAIFTME